MNVTVVNELGQALMCETPGCTQRATSVWSTGVVAGGASSGERRSCHQHNPSNNVAMALPVSFTSRTICQFCGK